MDNLLANSEKNVQNLQLAMFIYVLAQIELHSTHFSKKILSQWKMSALLYLTSFKSRTFIYARCDHIYVDSTQKRTFFLLTASFLLFSSNISKNEAIKISWDCFLSISFSVCPSFCFLLCFHLRIVSFFLTENE